MEKVEREKNEKEEKLWVQGEENEREKKTKILIKKLEIFF
jgi:hypothetical protein